LVSKIRTGPTAGLSILGKLADHRCHPECRFWVSWLTTAAILNMATGYLLNILICWGYSNQPLPLLALLVEQIHQ